MEHHMVKIKHNPKVSQERKKIYANQNKTARQFQVGGFRVFES